MYISDKQIVARILSELSLLGLTDQQIEAWAAGATDIVTVQQRIEQIGKELRDIEAVIEKIVNRISQQ